MREEDARMTFRVKHGLRHLPEYGVWKAMLQRCFNPRCKDYKHYGGRGIIVCKEWGWFPQFLLDMGHRPSAKHSIERIDNNGNYKPDNCRWATQLEQMSNMRKTWRYQGKSQKEWAVILGLTVPAIIRRFATYGDVYIPAHAKRALRRSAGYAKWRR